jgi:hypothetical protein
VKESRKKLLEELKKRVEGIKPPKKEVAKSYKPDLKLVKK